MELRSLAMAVLWAMGLPGVAQDCNWTKSLKTPSPIDLNFDGKISYGELHALTKVNPQTIGVPLSPAERWLLQQSSRLTRYQLLGQPIGQLLASASPPQRHVITSLSKEFHFPLGHSYRYSKEAIALHSTPLSPREITRLTRLELALIQVGMEQRIRNQGSAQALATLSKLQSCEQAAGGNSP